MKITFAGVGGAFTTQDYWQSNAVIESKEGGTFLLDCGSDARFSLAELNLTYRNIDAVYISHLHADHIGGLEWLGFCTYFDPNCKKPTLYIVDELVEPLWESLRAGMQSHEGVVLELSSFFNVVSVQINHCFTWQGINFCPIQTIHVMNGNGIVPSYGLIIRENGSQEKIFFTTDTQFWPKLQRFYDESTVIFHDCETYPFRSGVHAHYDDLKTLSEETKSKMWLYHYAPNPKQDFASDGFRGFVKKGQSFQF